MAPQIVITTSLVSPGEKLSRRQKAGAKSGPCWASLRAVVHPLLPVVRLPCLLHGFFSFAHAYLGFPPSRYTGIKLHLNWLKAPTWALCQKLVLIFLVCLSLFSFPETIRGMWCWFREGFVSSHLYDSDIWEETKRMWSLKKISPWTCQTRVWLIRK